MLRIRFDLGAISAVLGPGDRADTTRVLGSPPSYDHISYGGKSVMIKNQMLNILSGLLILFQAWDLSCGLTFPRILGLGLFYDLNLFQDSPVFPKSAPYVGATSPLNTKVNNSLQTNLSVKNKNQFFHKSFKQVFVRFCT